MTSIHILRARSSDLYYDHRDHAHVVYTIKSPTFVMTTGNFGSFRRMIDIIRSDDPHTEIWIAIEYDSDTIYWTGEINDLIIGGQS